MTLGPSPVEITEAKDSPQETRSTLQSSRYTALTVVFSLWLLESCFAWLSTQYNYCELRVSCKVRIRRVSLHMGIWHVSLYMEQRLGFVFSSDVCSEIWEGRTFCFHSFSLQLLVKHWAPQPQWWRGWKSEGWASSRPHSALKSLLFPHSFCVHDLLLKSRGGNDPRRGGGKRALPVQKQGWHFRETESWIWNCHEQRIPSKEIAHCSATGSPVTMGTGQRMTAGRSHLPGLKTPSDHLTTMIQAPPD